jgi:hypothetical protein
MEMGIAENAKTHFPGKEYFQTDVKMGKMVQFAQGLC